MRFVHRGRCVWTCCYHDVTCMVDVRCCSAPEGAVKKTMTWYGKLIGALLGAHRRLAAGSAPSSASCSVTSSTVPRRPTRATGGAARSSCSAAFFRATFQTMGHVAKADGRVSEREIVPRARRCDASRSTTRRCARRSSSSPTASARIFRSTTRIARAARSSPAGAPDLCRMFVQIQLEAALQGGGLGPAPRSMLARICGIARRVAARVRAARGDAAHARRPCERRRARGRRRRGEPRSPRRTQVLGVARIGDRCRGQEGLSPADEPEPSRQARRERPAGIDGRGRAERTQRIREAYELIREPRGIR